MVPSGAGKTTRCGTTSAAVGKSGGIRSAPSRRGVPCVRDMTAGSGGRFACAKIAATQPPSPVTTGAYSSPAPLVSAAGAARSAGTVYRCRRSSSAESAPVFAS
jgi:hypothetical protein